MDIRYSIFFLIFLTSCSSTPSNSVRIVKIVDGDTVHAINKKKEKIKIRLAGIDAPETRGKQHFGKAAKRRLIDLLDDNSTITLVGSKKDRYGRTISIIMQNGKDINLQMIRDGYAWHYKKYQDEQSEKNRILYAEAEILAREQKIGLFSDPNSIPPWEFRKR